MDFCSTRFAHLEIISNVIPPFGYTSGLCTRVNCHAVAILSGIAQSHFWVGKTTQILGFKDPDL